MSQVYHATYYLTLFHQVNGPLARTLHDITADVAQVEFAKEWQRDGVIQGRRSARLDCSLIIATMFRPIHTS